MISISEEHLKIVLDILKRFVPNSEVRVFGSRYKWAAKDYSDLDIAIVGENKLDVKVMGELKEAFEESDLPFRVDVLDWNALSPEFQKVIQEGYEVILDGRAGMGCGEWKEVRLGEVISFKNGRKKPDDNGCIPIYGGNGILGYTNSFNSENVVVIGRVGAYCGSVYYESEKCWISDNAISAQPDDKNDSVKYFYYVLKSLKLNERRIGTGQPLLTQSILNNIETIYPCSEEQKAIADTLSCLDDKIELNNRINKTLEEMARAIFKSWFVDFEPFQDGEFEDSELGRIPKGWRVGTIDEISVDMKNGGTPNRKTTQYWNSNDIPWIKTGEIRNGLIISSQEFISIEGLKNSSAKMLPYNTVLMAMYGATAGKVGILRFEASTNQACCAMICDNSKKSIYLYLWLLNNQSFIESLAVGAAQQNLSKDTISKLNILIPPDEVIKSLLFDELFLQIENSLFQNQILTTIRDSLLPKLMSGEIRVPVEE